MFYNFIKKFGSFFARILFPTKLSFEADVPAEGPIIICGKHIAAVDGPLSVAFFPRKISFMAKSELFKFKIAAKFFRSMGAFPVVRGGNDIGAVKMALTVLKSGGVLGIFPEGHCVKNNDRGPYKLGAFNLALKTKATIVPFGIYTEGYNRKLFKKSYMRFGAPMTYDELFGEGGKELLSQVGEKVMKKVYDLSEEHYGE